MKISFEKSSKHSMRNHQKMQQLFQALLRPRHNKSQSQITIKVFPPQDCIHGGLFWVHMWGLWQNTSDLWFLSCLGKNTQLKIVLHGGKYIHGEPDNRPQHNKKVDIWIENYAFFHKKIMKSSFEKSSGKSACLPDQWPVTTQFKKRYQTQKQNQ